jgi:hypothetical protein
MLKEGKLCYQVMRESGLTNIGAVFIALLVVMVMIPLAWIYDTCNIDEKDYVNFTGYE